LAPGFRVEQRKNRIALARAFAQYAPMPAGVLAGAAIRSDPLMKVEC
jgi:hypothetical protein